MEETKKGTESTEATEETTDDVVSKEDLPSEKELDKKLDKEATSETPVEKTEEVPEKRTVEEVPEVPSQPAPVQGESPRENALRLEVERLRTKLRTDTVKEIVDKTVTPETDIDPYKDLREQGYSDEEIKKMEVAVDLIVDKKGYVKSADSYKQNVQDTIDLFIDEHSEYKPINDVNDSRWIQFQSILQSGIYNLSGKTPRQLKTIFSKVDEDVKRELGEPIVVKKFTDEQLAAQKHKVNIASHSGGTQTIPKTESKIDLTQPIGGVHFKGFDSEDFKE